MCQWLILIFGWPDGWWPEGRLSEPPAEAHIIRVLPSTFEVGYAAFFASEFNRRQLAGPRRYWATALDLEAIDDSEEFLDQALEAEDLARGRKR